MQSVASEIRQIVQHVLPRLQQLPGDDPGYDQRPARKQWSRKEILGHLIDSACNNQQKFVRMMQQPQLRFPGYEQDAWVDLQQWVIADWEAMVSLWQFYNGHIAHLIQHVPEQHLSNTIVIDDAGPFELRFVMPDYVEHLKHHLKQIFPDLEMTSQFVNVYHS